MEPLNALLLAVFVLGLGLLIVLRVRHRPLRPARQEESVSVTAPARSIEADENQQSHARSTGHAFFTDRLFGGAAAALLLGGIVFVLEVVGLAGRVGAILAMPVAVFPTVESQLGPVFSGIAIVAVVAFAVGFTWPRLVHRIA